MSKHLRTLESVPQLPISSMTAPSIVGLFCPFDCEVQLGITWTFPWEGK